MPYPTRAEVYAIFKNLETPPSGTDKFFESVHPDVKWTVTGHSRFSETWTSKAAYHQATWATIGKIIAKPGYGLAVPGGEKGVIVSADNDGWTSVELRTVDVKTVSGVPYDQHYVWLCRFDENKMIVEARAFLDLAHMEDVLCGELDRQAAAKAKGTTNGVAK